MKRLTKEDFVEVYRVTRFWKPWSWQVYPVTLNDSVPDAKGRTWTEEAARAAASLAWTRMNLMRRPCPRCDGSGTTRAVWGGSGIGMLPPADWTCVECHGTGQK